MCPSGSRHSHGVECGPLLLTSSCHVPYAGTALPCWRAALPHTDSCGAPQPSCYDNSWSFPQLGCLLHVARLDHRSNQASAVQVLLSLHGHPSDPNPQTPPCRQYGCNICGEGGEYETLTLDCSLFTHGSISLEAWKVVEGSPDPVSPVGHLRPVRFHVQPKAQPGPELGTPEQLTTDEPQSPPQLRSRPQAVQPRTAGVPDAASACPAASAPDGTPAAPVHGEGRQLHQQPQLAGSLDPGRIIQVPSQLPRSSHPPWAVNDPQQDGREGWATAVPTFTESGHGVHAVCRPSISGDCDEAEARASQCGQALSRALRAINAGVGGLIAPGCG